MSSPPEASTHQIPPPPSTPPAASLHQSPHGNNPSRSSPVREPGPSKESPRAVKDPNLGQSFKVSGSGGAPRPSFKEVLLRPRTFRPRFPSVRHGENPWFDQRSMRPPRQPVRPGRSHGGRSGGLGPASNGRGYWLQYLRDKAGSKCFNCLSAGHRIASCRDPPRCVLCWRFGHKARFCRSPPLPPSGAAAAARSTASSSPAGAFPTASKSTGFFQGSNGLQQGPHHQRRNLQPVHRIWKWQVKKDSAIKSSSMEDGMVPLEPSLCAEEFLLVRAHLQPAVQGVDPMLEEASLAHGSRSSPPMASQCSVEPTVTTGVVAASGNHLEASGVLQSTDQPLKVGGSTMDKDQPMDLLSGNVLGDALITESTHVQSVAVCQTPLIDLNVDSLLLEEEVEGINCFDLGNRTVLGAAEGRLNKEIASEQTGPKLGRGIVRYAVPLKKSLMCNPMLKTRSTHIRKINAGQDEIGRKYSKTNTKAKNNLSMDEKATALLLQTCGIIEKNGVVTTAGEEQFGEKFVEHMNEGLVEGMRMVFGLNEGGAGEHLKVLALEAAE